MRNIIILLLVTMALFIFSGCAKYYSSKNENYKPSIVQNQIPVKVELAQKDWSIVYAAPDQDVKKNVSDILFDSQVFKEDNESSNVMKIDILHRNDHGGAELLNATLTGASLYLIPGVADSEVDINVSMNNVSSFYIGEMIVAQGIGSAAMIDDEKYIEDNPQNLMKNLLRNAINKFTEKYINENDALQ